MRTIKSVKTLDAAAATVNLASLDFDGNLNAIAAVLTQLDAQAEERDPVDLRIVVFPELCSTGPGAEDAFLRPAVLKRALASTLAAAKSVGADVVATVGLPLAFDGAVYKATAVLRDGAVRGFVCASTLAKSSDARQFAAWPAGKVATLNIGDVAVPVGDLAFVEAGTSFAVRTLAELATEAGERLDPFVAPETLDEKALYASFAEREIGEDAEDAEDAAFWESLSVEESGEDASTAAESGNAGNSEIGETAEDGAGVETGETLDRPASSSRLVVEGVLTDATLGSGRVDCVLSPSATPFAIGRRERIERILAKISRRDRNLIVYSTPVGVESGAAIFDGGSALALDGDVRTATRFPFVAATFATNRVEIAQTFNFSESAEVAQNADALGLLEVARLAEIDAEVAAALENVDLTTLKSEVCVDWGGEELCELEEGLEGWELDADAPFEEFARATALGLFDYMRKSRSRGFALSLSGGADSATIAALIRFGVKWGRRQLGTRLFLRWLTRYFSSTGSLDAFPALAALDAELGAAADAFENGDASRLAVFFAHSDADFEPALHSALESALHSAVDEALSTPAQPTREIYFGDCIDCDGAVDALLNDEPTVVEETTDFDAAETPADAQPSSLEENAEEATAGEECAAENLPFEENEKEGQDGETLPDAKDESVAFENGVENENKSLELSAEDEINADELNALFETLLTSDAPSALATSCELCAALEDALERRIVEPLLTTVYQATRNSGDVTRTAAREVAEFCGATHLEFDVDGIVEAYKTLVADATGTPFDWATDDLALQNIQARSRGPSVWLLANRSGRLLLSTGNRSEVACGYATMDGDTCGGLSPISGIDKAFVRKWLIWAEKTGALLDFDEEGNEIRFKAPALSFINDQQPTAELRPVEAKQTDEADLMPYTVLNLFERALIRDRLELDAAISRVRTEAAEAGIVVDDETLTGWGVRFARLWARTQWKRQRYAPGFPIDDYDLSPNSWTRYPILSEGFEREIADLQER